MIMTTLDQNFKTKPSRKLRLCILLQKKNLPFLKVIHTEMFTKKEFYYFYVYYAAY